MDNEWSTRVAKLAKTTLDERKFNQKKMLPEPEDVMKMCKYLNRQMELLENELGEAHFSTYRRACILVEAKLISYNRRRPGEIESIR